MPLETLFDVTKWILEKWYKLWPPLLAVILTQIFIESRKPKLKIIPEGGIDSGWSIGSSRQPFRAFRLTVCQKKMKYFPISRNTALQCSVELTFYNLENEILFTMQGRWANSIEISFYPENERMQKIIYPDRINIGYHSSEPLDCIVQYVSDKNTAYGWNNESYACNGRNDRCKLTPGKYNLQVKLFGENFLPIISKCTINIDNYWHRTCITSG